MASAFPCIHELVLAARFLLASDVRDAFAQCHPFLLAEWSPAYYALVPPGIMSHTVAHRLGSSLAT